MLSSSSSSRWWELFWRMFPGSGRFISLKVTADWSGWSEQPSFLSRCFFMFGVFSLGIVNKLLNLPPSTAASFSVTLRYPRSSFWRITRRTGQWSSFIRCSAPAKQNAVVSLLHVKPDATRRNMAEGSEEQQRKRKLRPHASLSPQNHLLLFTILSFIISLWSVWSEGDNKEDISLLWLSPTHWEVVRGTNYWENQTLIESQGKRVPVWTWMCWRSPIVWCQEKVNPEKWKEQRRVPAAGRLLFNSSADESPAFRSRIHDVRSFNEVVQVQKAKSVYNTVSYQRRLGLLWHEWEANQVRLNYFITSSGFS